jgi:hypothetical protein
MQNSLIVAQQTAWFPLILSLYFILFTFLVAAVWLASSRITNHAFSLFAAIITLIFHVTLQPDAAFFSFYLSVLAMLIASLSARFSRPLCASANSLILNQLNSNRK